MRSDCPLGKMTKYFYRVEGQKRGKLHLHMITYHEGSVRYKEGINEKDVISYVDKHISCHMPSMSDSNDDLCNLIELQKHRHRKRSCFKKHKKECRFGFPKPPMPKTTIMHPSNIRLLRYSESQEERNLFQKISNNWYKIYDMLENWNEENMSVSFQTFLTKYLNNLGEENYEEAYKSYVEAVSYSIKRTSLFLERLPHECRINNYNKELLRAWRANLDIQYF
jgi:hypothetical protein